MNGQKLILRRRIDLALGRALIDGEYAARLLADPALMLDIQELGSTPNGSLQELAARASAVFWHHG
jgi:hypothetical protein